ncbi:hypothetical protein GLYMA_09G068833v4 [Glycine max]|nr:hypothetical protein GLYMA_09G068833v4 [Glycine max]KAH1041882.1 hypothetical protein GYH30_024283 [Glycine max]
MEDGDVRHSVLEYILRTDDPLLPSTLIKKTLLLGTLQDHLYSGAGAGEGTFLLSLELEQWRSNIEASLSDLQVRERFAFVDTRREAAVKLELAASEQINNNVVAENRLEAQHQERGETEKCIPQQLLSFKRLGNMILRSYKSWLMILYSIHWK